MQKELPTQAVLERIPVLQDVASETLQFFMTHGQLEHYKKGEQIYLDKTPVSGIYMLVSGQVALYKISSRGMKKTIFVYHEDGTILNEAMLQDLPASVNCEAVSTCTLLRMPTQYFREAMESDLKLNRAVVDSMALKVRRLYRQLKNTTSDESMDRRLAAKLYKLGLDYGKTDLEGRFYIDLQLSVTTLADMVGCNRETISRQMKKLRERALVHIEGKTVYISNLEDLGDYFRHPEKG